MSGIEPGGFVHHTTLIEGGVTVMRGARVWAFCHPMEGCLIGPDVNVGAYCQIDRGVVIPYATRIGNGVWVYRGVELVKGKW